MDERTIRDPRPSQLGLLTVLQHVHTYSFTTKGDTAREWADEIAEGASRGFLTTAVRPGSDVFGRVWKLTPKGTDFLFDNGEELAGEEVRYAQLAS